MLMLIMCISFGFALPTPTLDVLLQPTGWNKEKTVKNKKVGAIQVYQKSIDDFPCFRGVGRSSTSIDVFSLIARDIPSALRWASSGLKESIVIEQTNKHVDYYQYLDIAIFSDRHWFLRGKFTQKTNQFSMAWEKIPAGEHRSFLAQKREKYPKAVEPLINLGAWRFTQEENGDTLVEYLICTHPGGSVPKQLRSVGTKKTLPTNVRDMILEGKRREK